MAIYYINSSADDGGDGTTQGLTGADCAWNELSDITGLSAGDTVSLNTGDEWQEVLVITTSGTTGNHITFGAYGAGADPIINGATTATGWALDSAAIYSKTFSYRPMVCVEDDTYLTFHHWDTDVATTFTGASAGCWTEDGSLTAYVWCTDNADPDTHTMEVAARTGNDRYGIYVYNSSYITIENLKIQYTTIQGIRVLVNTGTETDVHIEGCTLFNTGNNAIEIGSSASGTYQDFTAATVSGCTVSYSRRHGVIYSTSCSDGDITSNTTFRCGWGGTGVGGTGGHNISLWGTSTSLNPRNNTIASNISYSCYVASDGSEGTGIHADDNTQNCTFQYNLSYNNQGSAYYDNGTSGVAGNKWHYNIGYSSGTSAKGESRGGLTIQDGQDTEVFNNVFYNNKINGIGIIGAGSDGVTIKNNILIDNSNYEIRMGVNSGTNWDCDYNSFYNNGRSLLFRWVGSDKNFADWKTSSSGDANSISSDPLLVDAPNADFKLTGSSPCKDAGVSVSLAMDYYGNTVPVGAVEDIGSHEYPAESGPTVYYINTASTGSGDGTTTATSGATAAWKNLSEITGEAGGDFILLNKGNTWNEKLTMATSGSDGLPITFGAYGTGANPIIDGNIAEATWVVANDITTDNLLSNGKFTSATTGWAASNSAILSSEASGQDGNCLKILENAADNPSARQDMAVTPGDILQLTGYAHSGDEATINFQLMDVTNSATIWALGSTEAPANWLTQYDSGVQTVPVDCVLARVFLRQLASSGAGTYLYFDEVCLYNTEYYKKTISYAASIATLNEDGSPLTKKTWDTDLHTTFNGQGSGIWTNNGTTVYIRSTDDADPDTHTITADVDYCIDGNGKDWLVVEDITVQDGVTANLLFDGTNCIADAVTATSGDGIGIHVTGATGTVKNSTIHTNTGDGLVVSSNGGAYYSNSIYGNAAGAVLSGDTNDFYFNEVKDNSAIGLTLSGASNTPKYCLVENNTGDGVAVTGATNVIYNLVVQGSGGDGFDVDESCTIRNCIIRSSTGDDMSIANTKTVTGGYNCLEDAASTGTGTYTDTATSTLFSTDPLFTAAGSDDFTITGASPCINTGLDVSLTTDYVGTTVPIGAYPDMGCYETESTAEATITGPAPYVGTNW